MPPSCALLGGFAIGAWVALLWKHYRTLWKCVTDPAVIRHCRPTARRTHYACVRRAAKTPLTGDKIDAACAGPFRPYCGGGVTRTQNVSGSMPSYL